MAAFVVIGLLTFIYLEKVSLFWLHTIRGRILCSKFILLGLGKMMEIPVISSLKFHPWLPFYLPQLGTKWDRSYYASNYLIRICLRFIYCHWVHWYNLCNTCLIIIPHDWVIILYRFQPRYNLGIVTIKRLNKHGTESLFHKNLVLYMVHSLGDECISFSMANCVPF